MVRHPTFFLALGLVEHGRPTPGICCHMLKGVAMHGPDWWLWSSEPPFERPWRDTASSQLSTPQPTTTTTTTTTTTKQVCVAFW